MWLLYALLGVLIIFFPMLTKPRKETMKKMWVGYILLGIILGFMHVNRNKDDLIPIQHPINPIIIKNHGHSSGSAY